MGSPAGLSGASGCFAPGSCPQKGCRFSIFVSLAWGGESSPELLSSLQGVEPPDTMARQHGRQT